MLHNHYRYYFLYRFLFLLPVVLLLGCQKLHTGSDPTCSSEDAAEYLRIVDTLDYCRVDILNPWKKGELLSRLYLVRDEAIPTPADAPRLSVPVAQLAVTSATQVGFIHALGADSCIVALSTPHLIYNAPAREHSVTDIGEDFNLNMEALLYSAPQLVLITNYGEALTQVSRIREAGIATLELVEWMEQKPLARAAWIQLYGALLDRSQQADSILAEVQSAYRALCDTRVGTDVTIATGESFRGTWYVPSGSTYMGKLFADAGARYRFADRQSVGSIPLSLEQALTAFSDADVWVGVNESSLAELVEIDQKHTWMKAYQSGRVYNWRRRTTPAGGNDFWETGIVHPEYILRDIRWALDTTSNYVPYFIEQLN